MIVARMWRVPASGLASRTNLCVRKPVRLFQKPAGHETCRRWTPFSEPLLQFHQTVSVGNLEWKGIVAGRSVGRPPIKLTVLRIWFCGVANLTIGNAGVMATETRCVSKRGTNNT
jgi:hypothetical protein